MITLFKSNETDFTHNGLGNLDAYIQSPVVEEEINGLYSFSFRYPLFAPHGLEIEGESIVRVPVPEKEDQLFRVYRHVKSMGYITVSCFHIFYDLADNFIEDTNIVEKDGQGAIQQLGGATQFGHRFRFYSDIQTVANARVVRKNVVGAILDDEQGNSFVSRWGGELIRNNFDVRMNQNAGSNRGFEVKHRKNLTGYEADVDESTVYTRIMPKGFDGLLLPEKYIDSPLINNYESPKIKMIDYEVKAAIGEYANDEDAIPLEDAYAELRRLAKEEYTIHKIDIPTVSYRVDFVMLEQTEEYKDLADLQKLKMGDMVTVDHELDDFKVTAKLVRYKYDPIAERYLLAELGSIHEGITSNFTDIKKINREVTELKEQTLIIQATADGKNTIYRGTAEPGNPNVGDLWYKPNGSETQMYQFVNEDGVKYWKLIADTGDLTKVEKDIESALEEVEEAKQSAQTAVDTANQSKKDAETAINKANESFGKAENALASSSMALQQSADAYDKSLDAFDKAEDGLTQANTALDKAQEGFDLAQENAEEIEGIGLRIGDVEKDFTTISGNIQGLQTQVGNIAGDLSTVTQTANANQQQIQNAQGDINSLTQTATALQTRLSNAEGDISTVTNLASGTQQTVSNLQGDYTRLNTTVNGLQTEVGKKVDNTTYTTKMTQLDNAISQRVTKTDANNLYTQKAEFNQFADGFSQRVEEIEGWEIDGINLITDTEKEWESTSIASNSAYGVYKTGLTSIFSELVNKGVSVLFEVYLVNAVNTTADFRIYGTNGSPKYRMDQIVFRNIETNKWVIVTGTSKVVEATANTGQARIEFYGENNPNTTKIIIRKFKMVRGNKVPLTWTPAPEDTEQKFSAITQTIDNIDQRVQTNASNYSSISQTVQGIQNTVKDKANQSQVTQLSNLLNTTITSKADKSEVTQLSNLVDTKVTSSQVNNLIANDKRIKDTREDNQKPSWYFSNHPRETVREFKRNNVLGITSDGNYGVLETTIQWSNSSGGQIKQVLYTDVATYERRGNNSNDTWQAWKKVADVDYVEGRITVLNNAINLRVKEGEVLSQINIEANRTLIQSNKLILDADTVTVTGTFRVNNANIDSVDAGKMTTGTLNAALVNIININASNISTGTLQGIVITGNTINGGTINGAWIYSDGERGMVRINNGGISATDMRVLNNGTFFSEDGYVTLRAGGTNASTSHVYLQSAGEVRATKQQQYTSYINVRANQFLAESTFYSKGNAYLGDVNTVFGSNNGYTVVRSVSNSFVYLQGSEIRATTPTSNTSYVDLRAKQFTAESTFYSKGNAYLSDNNGVFGSNNGYVILRSVSNSFVYLQGTEIRATSPASTTTYADMRAKQIFAESTFYSKGNGYVGDNNTVFSSNNGYTVLRSVSNDAVYLQGNEVRATRAGDAGTYVPVRASSFPTGSLVEYKRDIEIWDGDALDIINNTTVYEYRLKNEYENGIDRKRQGLVVGEGYRISDYFIDGDGVEQYLINSISLKAIQELDVKLDLTREELVLKIADLEQRIHELESAA